ncbi:MAG TPA: CmcI family methyltransferase [Candidatus Binatia bacterium]|nr:CmcI family methyltransferase [Candidatus Binatia bacterium]
MSWLKNPRTRAALVLALAGLGIVSVAFRPLLIYSFNQLYVSAGVVRHTYWLGIPTLQTPTDMWMLQEIITELKPDFLVETGTYLGGSSLYFATVLSQVTPQGRVITVDVEDYRRKGHDASQFAVFRERVDFLQGSSLAPEVVQAIALKVQGHRVLVMLDSRHSRAYVRQELEQYAPLVSVGSYVVVHDTNRGVPAAWNFGHGPLGAIHEFLAHHLEFVLDRSREKFLLSYCPSGYLQRIR